MRSQKSRIMISLDNRDLAFSHLKFKNAMNTYLYRKTAEGIRMTKTDLRQDLANHLNLSPEAIKNYVQGYNGPADIEMVKKMAAYLEMDCTELMKEVSTMAENKMKEMEVKTEQITEQKTVQDHSTLPAVANNNAVYEISEYERAISWKAVREVYNAMRYFVSYFEGEMDVVVDSRDDAYPAIVHSYNACWDTMHKYMLDIPMKTYDELKVLLTDLEYWIYGNPSELFEENDEVKSGGHGHEFVYFKQINLLDLFEELNMDPLDMIEHVTRLVINEFYDSIREILKNYIPREPAASAVCPQVNPAKEVN